MPLSKEIEDMLPLLADLPEHWQRSTARWMRSAIRLEEEQRTMTHEQRKHLSLLKMRDLAREGEEFQEKVKRWKGRKGN